MSTDSSPLEIMQRGFHVALGASKALVDLILHAQPSEELIKIQQLVDQFVQDLEQTGEQVGQDANRLISKLLGQSHASQTYPVYIDQGSFQSGLQPSKSEDAQLYGFLLEGTLANLQDLCDKYLNNPTNGALHYRPVTNYVLLTFGNNPKLSSVPEPYSEMGTFAEDETLIWVLTMAGKQVGPVFLVNHLAWFIPYGFVDNSSALITGREVYGFPKEWGWFHIPESHEYPDQFSVDAVVLPRFSPQTQGVREPLIQVKWVNRDQVGDRPKPWNDLYEAFGDMIQILFEDGAIEVPGVGLPLNLLHYLTNEEVPMVFLKQMRNVADGRRASYQAIVEAPSKLLKFHTGRLLCEQFEVVIKLVDSHPIIHELGLKPSGQPAKLAFWLSFDFVIQNGKEVWKAPQGQS